MCHSRHPEHCLTLPCDRGALYECVTKEKPTALPAYLLLYCLKQVRLGKSVKVTYLS